MKISDKHFYTIFNDALYYEGERAAFISDHALGWEQNTDDPYQEPLDVNTPEFQERLEYVAQIWDVAHMSVRDICKASGRSQTALAMRFCIPLRTVQNWCTGQNACPNYDRLMMAENLGLLVR